MISLRPIVWTLAFSAFSSAAQAMDNPVHLSVIQGWEQADGTRLAGIRLDLDEGWKTYWRAPGEAGIPPSFDFTRSRNLQGFLVEWPTPVVFDQGGMSTIGYKDFVIFPVVMTPKRESRKIALRGTIDIGVCKDVCLPVSLDLNAEISANVTDRDPALAAAMASLPFAPTDVGVSKVACDLAPEDGGFVLSTSVTMPPAGSSEFAIFESSDPDHWLTETKSQRSGDTLVSTGSLSSMSGMALSVNRSDIRITVLGSDYAVDIQGCTGG
jgi:DsbC/DsbD-like thiol-disulfide interchange protein